MHVHVRSRGHEHSHNQLIIVLLPLRMDGWMDDEHNLFFSPFVSVCECEATVITRYVVIDDVMASVSASVYGFILWAVVLLFSTFF